MKLFVGIDVSSTTLDVSYITSGDNKEIHRNSVDNDIIGANRIKQEIIKLNTDYKFESITIGMESTSIYSFHPAYFFQSDDELSSLNTKTVVLNPKETKRYKDIYEENKTDSIDAFYIADYIRSGRYTSSVLKTEEYISLQRLTHARGDMVKELTRAKQHFIDNLYYKVNKLADKNFETPVYGDTMMKLLVDDMTIDEIANLPLEGLSEYLKVKSHGRFANPDRLAKAIKKAINGSYKLDKVIKNSVDVILAMYTNQIRALSLSIKQLDKSIADLVKVIPESQILLSIPGIGPVYCAGILAEIGDIERFNAESQLAKYAGLAWKQTQSGNFRGTITPSVKTGNRYLHYYLVEAANQIVRHDPVFRSYYDKKMSEVQRSPKKRALVLTARKLIRVIFYLLTNHQIYKPEEVV